MKGPCLLALPVLLLVLPAAAPAGDLNFKMLVRSIETRYQTAPTRIPLFGAVKFFLNVSRPHGVKQFDMAVFEDIDYGEPGEGEFDDLMSKCAGDGWRPMVRVRSRAPNEWTYVYVKEAGRDIRMTIAVFEPGEAVVMQYKVNLRRLMQMLERPERIGRDDR